MPFGWVLLDTKCEEVMEEMKRRQDQPMPAELIHAPQERVRYAGPAAEEKVTPPSEPISEKKETWENASLYWEPGSQTLTAIWGLKKAIGKGKDLVPEAFQSKLWGKKKKPVSTTVEVESVGNAYRILKVHSKIDG
jgi:hypothetical protein